MAHPSFTAMVFPCPGPTFLQQPAEAASSQQQPVASRQRQPVVSSQDSAASRHLLLAAAAAYPGLSFEQAAAAVAAGGSGVALFRAVSDETLGSFWSFFYGPSVLHCHGVSLSGTHVFAAASRSSQQQPVASSQ